MGTSTGGSLSNGTQIFQVKNPAPSTAKTSMFSGFDWAGLGSTLVSTVSGLWTTKMNNDTAKDIAKYQSEANAKYQSYLDQLTTGSTNTATTPPISAPAQGGGNNGLVIVLVVALLGIGVYFIINKK